ncbi:hypothetical protein AXX17_AT2G05480 [Arabidopsis thaliana]|uniref:DUF1985 domain-containing protein n=1 Tax=Arabidopsis thaliana TaxID=3702 RepID=A0A178VWC5_ARATH|nr:hypothetical protein AXX17_AT2G05480 [Arabidopsis thaliana]
MGSDADEIYQCVTGDLPPRLLALDCYPSHPVRINSYSKAKYLIDIYNVLYGTPELELLLQSPLGQLFTSEVDATLFVFAGKPLRFSLKEFEQVTSLCCSEYPSAAKVRSATSYADGESPYWYKLIGGQLGSATVKSVVSGLKSDCAMPSWRKFQISLVVIVEGALLSASQPMRPFVEVVEIVKNIDFFLNYPWERHSFSRTLRLMKVGSHIQSEECLIKKLNQLSLALHGFPLALQLFGFRYIPLLRTHLQHPVMNRLSVTRLCKHCGN